MDQYLAKLAFLVYQKALEGVVITAPWDEQIPEVQVAWRAAITAVIEEHESAKVDEACDS